MNDDEKWEEELRREDAEFVSELSEGKLTVSQSMEFFVARPEDYDACNVLVLVGFKDDAPLDEFRRELRRLGGVEFGGQTGGQIAAVEIEPEDDPET
jgi:hypothetical protein